MGITRYEKQLEKMSEKDRNIELLKIKKYFLEDLISDKEIAEILNLSVTSVKNVRNKYHIIRNRDQIIQATCNREWLTYNDAINNGIIPKPLSLESYKRFRHEIKIDIKYIEDCIHNKLMSSKEIGNSLNLHEDVIKLLQKEFNIFRTKSEIKLKTHITNNNKTLEQKQIEKENRKLAQVNRTIEQKQLSIQKMQATNLKKYGHKCSLQADHIREKVNKNNLEKYGTKNALNGYKAKQTKLERYGDENYNNREKYKETYKAMSEEIKRNIKNKTKNTCYELYNGSAPFKNENIRNKFKENFKNKYGVDNPFKLMEVRLKSEETCFKHYGVPYYCMTKEFKELYNNGVISKINYKFSDILTDLNINHELEFQLEHFSYDFKIGNILLEINPTYTHNSTRAPWFAGELAKPKDKYYHLNKSKVAQKYGFRCIHVWDWDDWNKIVNLLLPKETIYARKCKIREVSKQECNEFLNLYHLQSTCNGQSIRFGLYFNDKLIQIMTFGKPRYNKNYEWELLRLCSHKDYKIVGGSERLWKYFIKLYNPSNIISYCDFSKFSGMVYETLGMVKKNTTTPNIHWSKGSNHVTNNLLNQRGFDQLFGTDYGKETSNRELMIENNWLEVYDCGQQVWTYNK